MGGDLHGVLHDQAQEKLRDLPELPEYLTEQTQDCPSMQRLYDEKWSDHLPEGTEFCPYRDLKPYSIDVICAGCDINPCGCHDHSIYYIKPAFLYYKGYSELSKYSGRWFKVDCTWCGIRHGSYRKRKRTWN
jgi:hypothetical protein